MKYGPELDLPSNLDNVSNMLAYVKNFERAAILYDILAQLKIRKM